MQRIFDAGCSPQEYAAKGKAIEPPLGRGFVSDVKSANLINTGFIGVSVLMGTFVCGLLFGAIAVQDVVLRFHFCPVSAYPNFSTR